jgi:hypothetical protein
VTSQEINPLYQQMGEVVQGLRALSETIQIRHAQVDKLHDILRADVSVLRGDQKDLEEKLDCVICVMQSDLEGLRADAVTGSHSVNQLVKAVQELRQPVTQIVALRSQAAGLLVGLGVLGSAAIWLAEPIYRWFIEHAILKQ